MGPGPLNRQAATLVAAVATLLILSTAANAATLTVATTGDPATPDGQCSLREAIEAVDSPGSIGDCGEADGVSNTIVLGPHEYDLTIHPSGADDQTSGDLDVNGSAPPLTIEGAGVGVTSISGAAPQGQNPGAALQDRILHVLAGATVTIEDLTITGGQAPNGKDGQDGNNGTMVGPTAGDPGSPGGGVLNGGTLKLEDVAVTNNAAGSGGKGGTGLTSDGRGGLGGNGGAGGGIDNRGMLTLSDVVISGNFAGTGGQGGAGGDGGSAGPGNSGGCCGDGGGLENDGGTVMITGSMFSGNHAGSGGAGGNGGSGLQVGSAGAGGTGAGGSSGGAIATNGGKVTVTNSTLVGNFGAPGGKGGDGGTGDAFPTMDPAPKGGNSGNGSAGGGVFVHNGATVTMTNVTVDANRVGGPGAPGNAGDSDAAAGTTGNAAFGGGVDNSAASPATVTLANTLLASNELGNCGGQITDGGHNLSFSFSQCPAAFLSGDPKLGPLQDNGGLTPTEALGAGSAAIDQVPATGSGCPSTDQRGAARPSGSACDIGAYELALPVVGAATSTAVTSGGATVHASVTPNQSSASVVFDYGTTTSYGTATAAQTLVGGFVAQPVAVALTGLKPGTTYHFRVVATSADGTTTGADATFETTRSTPVLMTPRLTKLRVKLLKRGRAGAQISYSDSAAATTTIVVRRCVKRVNHGHGCKRFRAVGALKHVDVAGANSVTVHHKLGHHTLVRGRYELQLTPSLGGLVGRRVSIRFAI